VIDFRYHLVSLISVFLALAVGIVLGAGPLQGNLGSQLTGQVEQLRAEKEQLRTENETVSHGNDELSAYISETAPRLVSGTLTDTRTAVVLDDSSVQRAVDDIGGLVEDAGGQEGPVVLLDPTLWDPGEEKTRSSALDAVRQAAPDVATAAEDNSPSSSATLAAIVTRVLVDPDIESSVRASVWDALGKAGLVTVDGDTDQPVDGVVYAGTDPSDLTVAGDSSDDASLRAQTLLETQTQALTTLVGRHVPCVVAGITPANDDSTGLLRTVRGDQRFKTVSTTDRLQQPDGPVLAVLALAEQYQGGVGSYGTASDVDGRVPEVAPGSASSHASSDDAPDGASASDGGEG
jgi:hypothetical protein